MIIGIHVLGVMFLIDLAFGIRSLHYFRWLVLALMFGGPVILTLWRFNRSSLPFKFRDGSQMMGKAKSKWVLIGGIEFVAQLLVSLVRPMLESILRIDW